MKKSSLCNSLRKSFTKWSVIFLPHFYFSPPCSLLNYGRNSPTLGLIYLLSLCLQVIPMWLVPSPPLCLKVIILITIDISPTRLGFWLLQRFLSVLFLFNNVSPESKIVHGKYQVLKKICWLEK